MQKEGMANLLFSHPRFIATEGLAQDEIVA